jgi:hypothetical protein
MNKKVDYYPTHIDPYLKNAVVITLTEKEIKPCYPIVSERAAKKISQWKTDTDYRWERELTGMLGELAVEKWLGLNFIDWTHGLSKDYDSPDLKPLGLNVGIKCAIYGNYPCVPLNPTYPQIMALRKRIEGTRTNEILLCGIAKTVIVKQYQDELLITEEARERKAGFYGFNMLLPIASLKEKISNGQVSVRTS